MSDISPPPATLQPRQAQVALTSFVALFSIVGLALYGLPFYYDFMVRDFGWSRMQVTSGNALSKFLIGPIFGFMAGWIVDRFGPRRLMMAGIVMAGVALIGLAHMTSLWMFYAFYMLNALGYVCGGPLPNQVLLSRWFDRNRGKAMGFAYLGIGLGGYLVLILSPRLVNAFGWRGALQVLGILIVALALPMAWFVRDEPDGMSPPAPGAGAAPRQPAAVVPMGTIFRNPAFYLLAIGSMCSIGAVGGTNQHLKLFLSLDLQFSQTAAASIASTVLACSIAGRLLMGWLADRMPRKHVMLLIYVLIAGSIPLLFFAESTAALYAFAVIFGLGLGGEYMIIPLMAAELFGVRVLGRLLGVILTADGVAEATFPLLVGRLRDTTGSYQTGFVVLIAVALAGTAAIACLPRGQQQVERSHV
ncbi:MAG TPA: MFS transporter [Vicinamibacterales bacterium]|nr:MFS transporter [Vicinamibacterales bacterium]